MKHFVRGVLAIGLVSVVPVRGQAQDCGKGHKILKQLQVQVEKIADEIGCTYVQAQTGVPKPLCKIGAGLTHKAEKALNEKLRKAWRKLAKNSWATIGPRELRWGRKEKGKLVGTGGRMFVASLPASKRKVKITVRKTGGKGKAGVAICAISPGSGDGVRLAKRVFDKGKGTEKWTYTVDNAFGKNLMVHFDGKSVARSFSYTVEAVQID